MSNSFKKLEILFDRKDETFSDNAISNKFSYLFTKADLFLTVGEKEYLKQDYFDWTEGYFKAAIIEEIKSGCQQIMEGKGLSTENPLELSIGGFYALFELFHFKSTGHRSKKIIQNNEKAFIDEMYLEHVVDKEQVTYFNLVKK